MSENDRRDDHIGAHPQLWSSVELLVDPRPSFDTQTILGEWAQKNAGWSVSAISQEEVMRRAMDSLPSSALRSGLASRPDFAVDFGRFITLAADSRKVSVMPNFPPSDLSPDLEGFRGSILFDERGVTALVIATTVDSVFCESTIRVATRVIEEAQNVAFSAIIQSAASAARLLGADEPRIVRGLNLVRPRAQSKGEFRKWERWTRSLRPLGVNGQLRYPGTRRRYLIRLALAETAAVIVSRGYP
jgi:hypothetical protein